MWMFFMSSGHNLKYTSLDTARARIKEVYPQAIFDDRFIPGYVLVHRDLEMKRCGARLLGLLCAQ